MPDVPGFLGSSIRGSTAGSFATSVVAASDCPGPAREHPGAGEHRRLGGHTRGAGISTVPDRPGGVPLLASLGTSPHCVVPEDERRCVLPQLPCHPGNGVRAERRTAHPGAAGVFTFGDGAAIAARTRDGGAGSESGKQNGCKDLGEWRRRRGSDLTSYKPLADRADICHLHIRSLPVRSPGSAVAIGISHGVRRRRPPTVRPAPSAAPGTDRHRRGWRRRGEAPAAARQEGSG
jgi:hypothetical protein